MHTAPTFARSAGALALALTLAAGATAVLADDLETRRHTRASRPHSTAQGDLVEVRIKVDGRGAPLYFKPGAWDRHYFEALKGRNYSLVVRNQTGRRVGVVIAVDGLNVVNGERTSLSGHEPMYVLGPWEESEIRGWRTSLDDVRRFVFVDEHRSYAERSGKANGDLGWIRVVSFREVEPRAWFRGRESRDREDWNELDDAPSSPRDERRSDESSKMRAQGESLAPESSPGTGWGRRDHDPVGRTQFRAAARATDHLVLRYEYASGLRALGIFPQRSRLWEREAGQLGFAQPPRW